MKETCPTPKDEIWVLRIITDNCRYRLELFPYDTYQKVLDKVKSAAFRLFKKLDMILIPSKYATTTAKGLISNLNEN
jgi:hypothetical protein